jgi:spermidine synthase
METSLLYISMSEHGLLQVIHGTRSNLRVMLHDEVVRGMQSADPEREDEPLGYYERSGCIGRVLGAWDPAAGAGRVGVVGLGAGTLAAYAHPGMHFTFFEAHPGVATVAADPNLFTFLSRCRGTYEVVLGDARERLEQVVDGAFDLLVVDALVGARVPEELVSRDALDLYRRKLTGDGLLLVRVDTNGAQLPAMKEVAQEAGMCFCERGDPEPTDAERARGKMRARCLVLARDAARLQWLPGAAPAHDGVEEAVEPSDGHPARPEQAERVYPPYEGRALLQVTRDPERNFRVLLCEGACHGMQSLDPDRATEPVGFYDSAAPFGDLFMGWNPQGRAGHVGVIGLGVGVLAAYARPGQRFTFFEIDPRMATIARDPSLFSYLSRCRGTTDVVVGDGREGLERSADGTFDMIVVDAFVGSQIPPHFLSLDALSLYRSKLQPDGLLAFQINWDASQLPMLRELARDEGMSCSDRAAVRLSEADVARGQKESHVVVLAREAGLVPWLRDDPRWTTV